MSKKINKTAKDLAFDRERAKFGMQIKNLESKLSQKNNEVLELQKQIKTMELERDQLKDWVERLLEYTEISEDDIKTIVQKDLESAKAISMLTGLLKFSGFGSYY